jgi:hypothetical protein
VLNRGGNKLDWFTAVDGRITTAPAGDGTDVTVELTIRNQAPAGLPRYVAGPPSGQRWAPGTYVGVVALDVPAAATQVRISGARAPVAGRDGRVQVVTSAVQLARGDEQVVSVQFHLPGRHGALGVEPSARVPGITWRYGAGTWQDTQRRTTKW